MKGKSFFSQARKAFLVRFSALDSNLLKLARVLVVLACFFALCWLIDPSLVLNISPWIKPLKFSLSISVYSLTMGWIVTHYPNSIRKWSARIIIGVTLAEIFLMALQSARGESSHFNNASTFDFIVYILIASIVWANTGVVAYLLYWSRKNWMPLPKGYFRPVQYGLALFLLSNLLGVSMSVINSHTVGRPDGGPGLPFLGWSTVAGDLRIAHFISIHGLQLMIGMAFLTEDAGIIESGRKAGRAIIFLTFVGTALLSIWSLIYALLGKSPFAA